MQLVNSVPSQPLFCLYPVSKFLQGTACRLTIRRIFSQASRLLYFPVAGDFVLSCDVQLLGWTLLQAKDALLKLSLSGLSVAMLDDADASPFACWLFRSGRQTPVTVVQDDDDDDDDGADVITLYAGAG